jgi:23S rRNA (guanosine2251-2'-O)-methyltransferase
MKKKPSDRDQNRRLLYGVNPILESLRAGAGAPTEILIAEGARDERLRELIRLAGTRNIAIKRAPRAALDRLAGNTHHQGVVARIAPARYADADEILATLASDLNRKAEPLLVVLDGIEDPRNLGAILRTAECAGAHAVFIPERRAAGLNETVAKASAGATEHLSVARVTNLARLLEQLKERNVWIVGTAVDAEMSYLEWDWTRPSALVLGGEGAGLHRLVREHCDALVRIPVHGQIASLNVSVAAGIVLYEAIRQRVAVARASRP